MTTSVRVAQVAARERRVAMEAPVTTIPTTISREARVEGNRRRKRPPETPPKRTSRGRPGRPQAWTIHSSQRRTTSLGPPWRRSAGARESPGGGPGDNRPGLNSPVTQQSQDRGASPGGVTIQQPETLDEYQQIFRAYTGLASTGDAGKDQALWQAESQRGRGWLRPGRTRCWPWPPSSARSQPTGWT